MLKFTITILNSNNFSPVPTIHLPLIICATLRFPLFLYFTQADDAVFVVIREKKRVKKWAILN